MLVARCGGKKMKIEKLKIRFPFVIHLSKLHVN